MGQRKVLSRSMLVIVPLGIALNYAGVQLALHLKLPLFLDSIGTLLSSILGGPLSGITVGFLSNSLNSIGDPITLYYGIASVFIALLAAELARRGVFASLRKTLLSAFAFALVGGGLGSVLTWLLYGFGIGTGISAPYAVMLEKVIALPPFVAQLVADLAIDVVDKLVSVLAVYAGLRLLPARTLLLCPFGSYSLRGEMPARQEELPRIPRHSLRAEILLLIISAALVLGTLATAISFAIYRDTMTERFASLCESATSLMRREIDANKIDDYLAACDEGDPSYQDARHTLAAIRSCFADVEYMYVYQIREDGCHVVFDLDTQELKGEPLGAVIPFDEDFSAYHEALLNGEAIPPVITNGSYGYLLTVYKPLRAEDGHTAAYAAVDVAMRDVITDRYVFIIKMISLLFGASILLIMVSIALADGRLVKPINAITVSADRFAYASERERARSVAEFQNINIHTGNEIENLYAAVLKAMTDITSYIDTIDALQSNTLLAFASMVEERDESTGEHIRHTALYVRRIAERLQKKPEYAEVLTDGAIDSLEKCAPLHDVGKIRISDALLNKPGRLTPEEFEIMKTHTTVGQEIMRTLMEHTEGMGYLHMAAEMAGCHHEWWDGSGYPAGLAGRQIPLSARIMAVADVYDALISRRSYKAAFTEEKARDIIVSERGTHFDPDVVDAFLQSFNARWEA